MVCMHCGLRSRVVSQLVLEGRPVGMVCDACWRKFWLVFGVTLESVVISNGVSDQELA